MIMRVWTLPKLQALLTRISHPGGAHSSGGRELLTMLTLGRLEIHQARRHLQNW